jgi:hypothetical protein
MVSISVLIPFLMEKINQGESEAKEFIENYKVKYTTKGFITRYSIQGVCEVL